MTLKELRSNVVLSIEVVEQYYSTMERPQRILSNIWVSQTVVGTKSRKIQYFLCYGLCMEETSSPLHWPLFFWDYNYSIFPFLSLIQALTFITLLQIHGLLFSQIVIVYVHVYLNTYISLNTTCLFCKMILACIFSGIAIWH